MRTLAPIILFVFNRPEHTRKTLLSLKENELAKDSLLIIYVDGLKFNSTEEQKERNEAVKKVIREEVWCKEVVIIESENNKGLAKSIVDGVTENVRKYGKVIVLEDDLITDRFFLKFMNDGLDMYEFEDSVACISGYIYPVKNVLPNTFFIKGADCWGWATWERSWDLYDDNGSRLLEQLEDKKLSFDFNFFNSYPYIDMLKDQIDKKNNSWAILWYASAYLRNKLTLYPGKSLIQNIGIDGSGIHSGESNLFDVEILNQEVILEKIPVLENVSAKKNISEYFHVIFKVNKVTFLKRIYSKLISKFIS